MLRTERLHNLNRMTIMVMRFRLWEVLTKSKLSCREVCACPSRRLHAARDRRCRQLRNGHGLQRAEAHALKHHRRHHVLDVGLGRQVDDLLRCRRDARGVATVRRLENWRAVAVQLIRWGGNIGVGRSCLRRPIRACPCWQASSVFLSLSSFLCQLPS